MSSALAKYRAAKSVKTKGKKKKVKYHHSGLFEPGKQFGHFLLIKIIKKPTLSPPIRKQWQVKCRCGKISVIPEAYMRRKDSPKVHCGCLRPESLVTKYNDEYHIWKMVHKRCLDAAHNSFPNYGGVGIKIAEEWLSSSSDNMGFDRFITYMGPRPTKLHSLDRIDPYGNYAPGNVRWADKVEQANNKKEHWILPAHRGHLPPEKWFVGDIDPRSVPHKPLPLE